MPNLPEPGAGRSRFDNSLNGARGIPLVVYSVVGGILAVGAATAMIRLTGGNSLDWLTFLVIVVVAAGWYAAPLLRWLSSLRR